MKLQIHNISMGMVQAYLIESQTGLLLIDAGLPGYEQRVLRIMEALGRDDLQLIFITHAHFDHYGSAAALRRLTGAPIAIHQADGEAMARGETRLGSVRGRGKMVRALLPLFEAILRPEPTTADYLFSDGDDLRAFGLEALVLHTPGHTAGSSCLLAGGRLAFVGDLLSGTGRLHAQRFFASDWPLIDDSLARLRAARPEWIYAGHGRSPLPGEKLTLLQK